MRYACAAGDAVFQIMRHKAKTVTYITKIPHSTSLDAFPGNRKNYTMKKKANPINTVINYKIILGSPQ